MYSDLMFVINKFLYQAICFHEWKVSSLRDQLITGPRPTLVLKAGGLFRDTGMGPIG